MSEWESRNIKFEIIPAARINEVNDMLVENFFPDEPISKGLDLKADPLWLGHFKRCTSDVLKDNLSIMAVEGDTGNILGVRLSRRTRPSDPDLYQPSQTESFWFFCASAFRFVWRKGYTELKKWLTTVKFLDELAGSVDVHEKYQVSEIMDFVAVCTNKNARVKGLGTELIQRSLQLAKDCGFKVIRVEATSRFSQRIFEKAGFETLNEIEYKDYVVNGKHILNNTGVHDSAKLMVKII